jgi:hypothetical protein
MTRLRFAGKRSFSSPADLTQPSDAAQLAKAGTLWDGEDLPAEARLAEGGPDESESSFAGFCDHYRVLDGDTHVFDAWLYMVDSGAFFRAGTTEEVASIIQFGLECEDPDLRRRLGPAMVEAKLLPAADASYAEFKALLDAEPA